MADNNLQDHNNENDRTDPKNGPSTDHDEDQANDGSANVADQASQSSENQIEADSLDKKLRPSQEEANEGGGNSQEDTGEYSPSGSTQFDSDTQRMTTENPDYRNNNGLNLKSDDLSGLGDPIDSDLTLIKQHLDQNYQALADLDVESPNALHKMRNLLLLNNQTEQRMYRLISQLEYSSADYSKIKDRLIDSEDKEKLSKYIDELSPLFKVTDKKQMNTFINAFHRIINIEKNGSLSNLIELADYYNEYFKKDNPDSSKQNDDKDPQGGNASKPGKDVGNDSTDRQ